VKELGDGILRHISQEWRNLDEANPETFAHFLTRSSRKAFKYDWSALDPLGTILDRSATDSEAMESDLFRDEVNGLSRIDLLPLSPHPRRLPPTSYCCSCVEFASGASDLDLLMRVRGERSSLVLERCSVR